jgi:hypothetical protein
MFLGPSSMSNFFVMVRRVRETGSDDEVGTDLGRAGLKGSSTASPFARKTASSTSVPGPVL